jgi:hypothetical protein
MAVSGLLITVVGVLACGLLIVAAIGVAWAISSNRRPPST